MSKPKVSQEDKIRLIYEYRTTLLNRMFDELCRKSPSSSTEQVSNEMIATAAAIQNALAASDEVCNPGHGLFGLALQQVVDYFLAALLTDEAFEWLTAEEQRADQILLEDIDLGPHSEHADHRRGSVAQRIS
jgi:hypothetical protein